MQQIIIDFGTLDLFGGVSLRIYGYGLMMVLGFLAAIGIARWRARRMGENPDTMMQVGILSLIGGVLGARLAFVIQEAIAGKTHDLASILNITSGGLIYFGGLVLGAVMVLAYLLIKRLPIRRYLDMVAVSMMVGLAFGRAGCFLNGCCYGGPCRHDWPLGMRFPMYSTPLLKLDARDNPFSLGQDGASPVYHHQLVRRAEAIRRASGGYDHPITLGPKAAAHGLVSPPPQLVNFKLTDRVIVERDGREMKLNVLRVHPPRDLHGKLERDQWAVITRPHMDTEAAFEALAGADARLDEAEFRKGLAAGDGLLGGSEHWGEAIAYDKASSIGRRDGKLDFEEFDEYVIERKDMLVQRFGQKGNTELTDEQAAAANAFLQKDEIALAQATTSLPVKPAQVLGIVNALLLAGILTVFYRLRTREGQVFALLLVLYPITRFMLEAIRDDNPHNLLAGVLTHNQWSALPMTAAGVLGLLLLRRLPPSCGATWTQRLARSDAGGHKRSGL